MVAKIIITGVKGFIGAYAATTFRNLGHTVIGFDQGTIHQVSEYISSCRGDIDAILHFGAISSTDASDRELVFKLNVESTINHVLLPAEHYGIPIHFASSASIYGNVPKYSYSENDEPNPNSYYAESKLTCETVLKLYEKSVIFRYFNVYADNPRWEWHKHQPSPYTAFKKQLSTTGMIKVFEGSENIYRDFVNVSDVMGYHLVFLRNNLPGGIYNVGSGSMTSFMEVAHEVVKTIGWNESLIKIVEFPEDKKKYYQYRTLADITKIKGATNGYR